MIHSPLSLWPFFPLLTVTRAKSKIMMDWGGGKEEESLREKRSKGAKRGDGRKKEEGAEGETVAYYLTTVVPDQ